MSKIIALILVVVMMFTCLVACKPNNSNDKDNENNNNNNPPAGGDTPGEDTPGEDTPAPNPLAGTYDITLWASEIDGVAALFQSQIDAFEAANPGIVINATIEGVSEADAGSQVLADIATAPDMYCFAQDQLARLVQGGALAAPSEAVANVIKSSNDAGSVAAGTVAGQLYAYPMTSDNGYYMYYNTELIDATAAESLEAIIAICEENNLKFRFALENAWYTASFFFATGCHSNWTMDADGNYNAVDDNFNSAAGLVAMKGMQKLAKSSCYDSNADIFTDAAVVITGIWAADAAATHFGENLGATDLPSFTVDGQSYHLGSYTGNKLIGVKPQADSKKGAVLSLLATYLTNAECQSQRFAQFQWGPSNLVAQASDAVQANVSLAALALQGAYGQPQGQIHGSWWDIAKVLGADAKAATSDAELQTSLDTYKAAIEALFSMTDEQKMAWGVIGAICGTNWDTDLPMTKKAEGVWESEALTLNQGEQFKLRRGAAWDVQVGADGQVKTATVEPSNIVVETTGTYIIRLEWDGTSETATVTFVPVTE